MKRCACGETLDIRLRTLIYSRTVEINHVPIYACDSCMFTEVLPGVKPQLTELLGKLGKHPERQKLDFIECCEWAYLITLATDKSHAHEAIQSIIRQRIDQLLDMLLLARSLGDQKWETELHEKLAQITNPVPAT